MGRAAGSRLACAIAAAGALVWGGNAEAWAQSPELESRIVALADRIRSDPSFKIRALAARQLGHLSQAGLRSNVKVTRALRSCLSDAHPVVRTVCADGLGQHLDLDSIEALEVVISRDDNEGVRRQARRALTRIRAQMAPMPSEPRILAGTRAAPRERVELGHVQIEDRAGLPMSLATALEEQLTAASEDRLLPHRPALFPREQAVLRVDVLLKRTVVGQQGDLRYEARVLLVRLPQDSLRHVVSATATLRGRERRGRNGEEQELRVAREATGRALSEALALLE